MVGLLNLLVEVIESSLKVSQVLLSRGLATVDLISGGASISNLVHDDSLVLLNLGLDLVQLLNLLLHLGVSILMLLLQSNNGGLLLDLGLLQVSSQLGDFSLSLLVELNLGAGCSTGLIETLTKVLQLTGEVRSLALSLGSALSLSLKFLLHLLNSGLNLLDGLLDLGNQGLFVLQLAHQTRGILLLASNGILQFLPGSLQLRNSFMHNLQFSLNLPSLLLNVGSATLLLLIRAFQLIKSGLKLVLDLVQMVDLVLSNLEVLLGLGGILAYVLLLLVQLVDDLILVGNLVIEAADGVVTVGLLLLQLLDGNIDVINVLLDCNSLLLQDLLVLHSILTVLLSLGQFVLSSLKLLLIVSNLSCGLGLLLVVDGEVALLLLQLGQQGLLLFLDGLILLQQFGLGLELLIVLAIDGVCLLLKNSEFLLRVGFSNQWTSSLNDDKPSPFSHGHVLSEVSLANLDQFSLISLLGKDLSSGPLEDLSLDESDPFDDQVITSLLKTSKSSSSEEDKSVSQPVSLTVKSNLVHEGIGGNLVVRGGSNLSLSKTDQVDRGDSLATTSLLLLLTLILLDLSGLSRMVGPEENQELTGAGGLHDLNNSVINGILVLLKPSSDVVGHNTSVVRDGKVSIFVSLGLGLQEDWQLAKGSLQLLLKGLVSGLGEEGLLFKNGPDTHGLLKHDDGGSQVHAKIHHLPVNTFLDVLFLFNNEHVVVEELLELLIHKVDGNLFKAIVLENLETSNIQDSTEVGLLQSWIN